MDTGPCLNAADRNGRLALYAAERQGKETDDLVNTHTRN